MNLQDRFMEAALSVLDGVLNVLTFGFWSRWQGERREYQIK